MVIFDGEYLIVRIKRESYRELLKLSEKSSHFEYLPTVNSVVLSPTRKIARELYDLGYPFDSTAKVFLKDRKKDVDFKSVDGTKELYPFQKEGVKAMIHSEGNVLLGDEMGLGKTPQASSYIRWGNETLPALIVTPASLKEKWREEIKTWSGKDSYVIYGKKSKNLSKIMKEYSVIIINYDILGSDNPDDRKYLQLLKDKIKKLKKRLDETDDMSVRNKINTRINAYKNAKKNFTIRVDGWCNELSKIKFRTIIGDEIQQISGIDTMRTRAMTNIAFSLPESKKIMISGTPYETKTLQFYPSLHIIYPQYFNNEWKFKMRYCDPVKTYFGWKFEGLSNGKELHDIISKFMIRRFKKDVLKELPPKIRSVIPMRISSKDRKLYDDIDRELEQAIINGEKNPLAKLEALKQASFKAKKNSMVQWVKDYLESNEKLVVFIWHKEAFDVLNKEFKSVSVAITGETPTKMRDKIEKKFQTNPKIRLFIGNIKSAGVGLTLTKSKAVAFLEFGNTAPGMEQAEDRVHRITQEADSVLAYYLIMQNSIDEQQMEVLNKRNKDLKMVLNGEDEDLFSIKKEREFNKLILDEYKKKKNLKIKSYNIG